MRLLPSLSLLGCCFAFVLAAQSDVVASSSQASSPWAVHENIKARLIVDQDSIHESNEKLRGAISLQLTDGWHTYWRTAGDSGLPPEFKWEGSTNLGDIKIFWPPPKRFDEAGFTTFGYSGDVNFPVHFSLAEKGKPLDLVLKLNVMICKDICIPERLETKLSLPQGDGTQSVFERDVNLAFRSLPHAGNLDDLKVSNLVLGLDKIVITAKDNRGFADDNNVFVEIPGWVVSAFPERQTTNDPTVMRFIFVAPDGVENLSQEVSGNDITVTLVNRGRAVEKIFSF